jgi:hypothetical protein
MDHSIDALANCPTRLACSDCLKRATADEKFATSTVINRTIRGKRAQIGEVTTGDEITRNGSGSIYVMCGALIEVSSRRSCLGRSRR